MSILESTAGHAIGSGTVSAEEQKLQVRIEQLKLLYGSLPITSIATLINALVLTAVLWPVAAPSLLLSWFVYMTSVQTGRILLSRRFAAAKMDSHAACDTWRRLFALGTVAIASGWGLASLLLFPVDSMMHQVFLAFIIGGMAAGSVTVLYPARPATMAFMALTLLPLALRFQMLDTPISTAMAVMLLLFLFMLLVIAERLRTNMLDTLATRFKSEASEQQQRLFGARLRDIVLSSSDLFWETDLEGRYSYCSSRVKELYGFRVGELIGKTMFELMDNHEAAKLKQIWQEAIELRQPFHDAISIRRHRTGHPVVLQTTAIPIFDEREQCIGFRGVDKDITEQRQAEAQLRILSEAVAQAGESIVITDRNGVIEYVNTAFTRITGYTPAEVIGKTPALLKSGEQPQQFYHDMWQTISSGKAWEGNMIDQRKDGSYYPVNMSIAPILEPEGEVTHYVGIQQDMTEQQELEEQFRQAQKMEAMGTLVGGMAHDFNNMLFGITGNLFLAGELVKENREAAELIGNAEKLGFDAAEMIRQLLTFARKGNIDIHPFGFTSFIKEISKLNAISIPENIRLKTRISKKELIIWGDATQLHQVILNLLTNARDALEQRPNPAIEIHLEEYEADEEFRKAHQDHGESLYAHLQIRDNGCGIAPEAMERVFEPFYTTKEAGRGTGLGMAMVFGAVQSHKGIIDIDSTPGSGTTVHIYLPLLAESELPGHTREQTSLLHGNGETILICDDNAGVLEAGANILQSLGYRPVKARDGREAVEIFRQHQGEIDLVLIDVVMPRLGGVEAVAEIRALQADIPVIFVTGYDRDRSLTGSDGGEAPTVLDKPFSPEKLSRELRAHLQR
jgi:PAS domain S-box-containing protein